MNTQAPPAVLDVWLAPQASSDLTNAAIRIRSGHVEICLRFPDALPYAERAVILAQLEETIAKRKAFYLAHDGSAVPLQRAGEVHTPLVPRWPGDVGASGEIDPVAAKAARRPDVIEVGEGS